MLYDKLYKICDKDRIVIYGAATTGAIAYKNLTKLGLHIIAFLDSRADEIDSYYGLPVWTIEEMKTHTITDEIIIFVAVKNVFEHEKIAQKIFGYGYNKVIFRPYKEIAGKGNENDKYMNLAYEELLRGIELKEAYAISGIEPYELQDKGLLRDMGEMVIANIPLVDVYTDDYSNENIVWGDIPCLGLIAHIGLFDVFSGTYNEDYEEYMVFCREAAKRSGDILVSDLWEKSVYCNRMDVYNHMEYAWEHDKEFFIRNAVEGKYNNKGYFNINSGKHRVVFMIVKGSRYVPLKIKKEEYMQWANREWAEELNYFLLNQHIYDLPVPLTNPYFYQFPCSATYFYEKTLHKIITEIYRYKYFQYHKFDIKDEKIFFYNTPMVIYADVFAKLGFHIYIFEGEVKKKNGYEIFLQNISYIKIENIGQLKKEKGFLLSILNEDDKNITRNVNSEIQISIKNNGKTSVGDQMLICGYAEDEVKSVYIRKG